MAWNTITTTNQALEKDYIHDFATSNFPLTFFIDLGNGTEILNYIQGPVFGDNFITTVNTWTAPGTGHPGLFAHPYDGFSVLMKSTGNLAPNVDGNGISRNINVGGKLMSRTHVFAFGNNGNYGAAIGGSYDLLYNSAGSKTVDLHLYALYNASWIGGLGDIPQELGIPRFGTKSFTFNVYQQAVAVTKLNNPAGSTLVDGATLNNMNYGDTLTLNKTVNRGDSVQSEWFFYKQDANGIFQPAVLGVDYTYLSGTSTSDTIQIRWEASGYFKVVNRVEGQSSSTSGINFNESSLIVPVGITVVETINLPLVQTIITPEVVYTNTVVSTEPLIGIDTFTVNVEGELNVAQAEWSQTIDSTTTVFPMTEAAWRSELLTRCFVRCQVKQGNIVIEQRTGLGPHQFTLNAGEYSVGYLVTPKPGSLIFTTLATITGQVFF